MKLTLAIVALAALADAIAVDGGRDPADKAWTKKPRGLRRNGTQFDRNTEANRVDYDQLARKECIAGAMAFDDVCLGVKNDRRYVDWRNERDPDGEDHECAYSDEPSQAHCLAQQCMYEYCIWRRDEYVASCEAFPTLWEDAVEQVGCKRERNGTCDILNEKVAFARHPGSTFETAGRHAAEKKLSRTPGLQRLHRRDEIYDDLIELADGTLSFERGCDAFYEFVDPEYEGLWESADEGDEDEDEDNGDDENGNDDNGDGGDGNGDGGDDGSNELDGDDGGDGGEEENTCQDTNNGATDQIGNSCADYTFDNFWCGSENYYDETFNAEEMCCACGGGTTGGNDEGGNDDGGDQEPTGQCYDIDNGLTDKYDGKCDVYTAEHHCTASAYGSSGFNADDQCCICGGGTYDESEADQVPTEECQDTNNGATDDWFQGCGAYVTIVEESGSCWRADGLWNDDFNAVEMCCVCGGGSTR